MNACCTVCGKSLGRGRQLQGMRVHPHCRRALPAGELERAITRAEEVLGRLRQRRGSAVDELLVHATAQAQQLLADLRRYIEQVLTLSGDNKSQAARLLGLDRRTLYRKLERYEQGAESRPPEA